MGSRKPIRLGLMAPFTGLVEMYGNEISWAGQIACEEVNRAGGVLGQDLELIVVDDGSQPEMAVPAALNLVQEQQCCAIIGNLLSNSRIAVNHQVAEPYAIPYLNFSFYEGSIYGKYFFSFSALPNQQIDKMIPYMAQTMGPKFYFAGSNYEWPRGSISAAKKALLDNGGEIVGEDYLEFGTTDYSQLLAAVSRSGANVFVPYFAGSDQLALLTQFSASGLKDRMAVVMGHYDEAMISKLPADIRGGFYSSNTYFMSVDTEENKRYLSLLAKHPAVSGIWPKGNGVLTNFGEGVYVCVKAFAKAANEAGTIEAEQLITKLATIEVLGPQGLVSMDSTCHHAIVNSHLMRSTDEGVFEQVANFGSIAPAIPERYQSEFGLAMESNRINNTANSNPKAKHSPANQISQAALQWRLLGFTTLSKSGAVIDEGKESSQHSNEGQLETGLLSYLTELTTYIRNKAEQQKILYIPAPGFIIERHKAYSLKIVTLDAERDSIDIAVYVGDRELPENHDNPIMNLVDGAIICANSDGNITQVSGTSRSLFQYESKELIGRPLNILIPPRFRNIHAKHFAKFLDSDVNQRQMSGRGEIIAYRKNGSEFPAEASIAKLRNANGTLMVATLRDISEKKEIESTFVWQANHDPLTGLPNRALINDRLQHALKRCGRSTEKLAVLFIDIDDFKLINDSFGHSVGDEILVDVSNRLIKGVRPGDTVGRFGGDEFIVLCESLAPSSNFPKIVERILKTMKKPFETQNQKIFVTVSIGVAMSDARTNTPELLLQKADVAMYSAKRTGKDCWLDYRQKMEDDTREYMTIANGLRSAISEGEFYPVLQPIIDINTGLLSGAEVLLRWNHRGEKISPVDFIPIAELTGMIQPIGIWVFEQACNIIKRWNQYFVDGKINYLSVNLSTKQITDPSLPKTFNKILEAAAIDPQHLLFEITETAIMSDKERSVEILNELGGLGLKLAIDDFGSGYSSLGQLLNFPIDKLKIDKMFVDKLGLHPHSDMLVATIVNIGHSLGLTVIAEGVEEQHQVKRLQELHCDNIQGYYYSQPICEAEFEKKFLQERYMLAALPDTPSQLASQNTNQTPLSRQ